MDEISIILLFFSIAVAISILIAVILTKKRTIKTYYDDIDQMKTKYHINKFGQKHGKEKIYDRNGRKNKVSHWKNGERNGKFVVYWDNGRKYIEGAYKGGNLTGDYIVYEKNSRDIVYKKNYD